MVKTMRVLNWNISHGGGSRVSAICRHIEDVHPDLLGLTEFQARNEPLLRAQLERVGYPSILTSKLVANRNGLLVACKWQLQDVCDYTPEIDPERWLALRLDELDLDILVLHIPGAPDNKFEGGYGISGAKRKELFWERTIDYAVDHKDRRVIIMGDFNTGFKIDAEGTNFKKSHYMAKLLDAGFIDTWRHLHAHERDYTWFSKRKDKTTGKSQDLNGFRLDYIFVSPPLQQAIVDTAILHEPRTAGASDHASVVATINLPEAGATKTHAEGEVSKETPANAEPSDVASDKPVYLRGRQLGVLKTSRNLNARFEIANSLSDMTCGLDGQEFLQQFRPVYVTAKWSDGVLAEVRIWGPHRLRDGSLGTRELDRRWKRPAAKGGVNYSDLPPSVSARLKSYINNNGLMNPPQ